MDAARAISELRAERKEIEEAILALEAANRLAAARGEESQARSMSATAGFSGPGGSQ